MSTTKGTPLRAFAILWLAAAIGAAGGVLGVAFQRALNWIQHTLIGPDAHLSEAVRGLPPLSTVLVPTIGGVVAGLLLLLAGKKAPFGIADITGLVQLRKGTIRVRDSIVQILSSASTIGTGGSIGREGANSHIAATVAAVLCSTFRQGTRARSVLLGCGVAAGMATSYNSPIAGAIFVMEAVLGNFAMDVFAPIVVASVIATMVRGALWEKQGAIYGDCLANSNPLEWNLILAALLLGVICGVGGNLFRASLKLGKRVFRAVPLPKPLVLGLGGLCVGLIGLVRPETWGNGYEVIETLTTATPAVGVVAALVLGKVVATAATVGSGGLGGIFTPNLVVGAAFGAFFAYGVDWLGSGTADPATAQQMRATFTFVGMAGLCAAVTHAPVTSVVLVFELTRHYEIVLPVMLCSIVASVVASMLDRDSYYAEALRSRGEEVPAGIEELAIKTTFVRDVMRRDALHVRDTASFDEVMDLLTNHRGDTLYVVDADGKVIGRIQLQDVKNFINDPTLSSVVIAADLTRPAVLAKADDSLASVMPLFDDPELPELAVVSTAGPPRLLGRVRHQDLITGISTEVLGQQQRRTRFQRDDGRRAGSIAVPPGWEIAEVPVPAAWVGLSVDNLPPEVVKSATPILVEVRLGDGKSERIAATPEVVFAEGSKVVVLGTHEAVRLLREGISAPE
jgi:CIC family chloride channel protein